MVDLLEESMLMERLLIFYLYISIWHEDFIMADSVMAMCEYLVLLYTLLL